MYRGYNLELSLNQKSIDNYYHSGKQLFEGDKVIVRQSLSDFIFSENSLDGSKIQATWFPQTNADIFISHSHNDETIAITLAGWLWETFQLKAFIDSCIWGYSDDLLILIDNTYCLQSSGNYNYNKRNFSTSHVHMMLSSALSMMLDKTECVFFINTPSSVKPYEGIQKTESPWIYCEIVMTQLLRVNEPERLKDLNESQWRNASGPTNLEKAQKTFSISHDIDLGHLKYINLENLLTWQKTHQRGYSLDTLYRLYPSAIKY